MLWLLVTGSRRIKDTPENRQVITAELRLATSNEPDAYLLVGDCQGLDTIALDIWRTTRHRNRMRYQRFDADWGKYGLRAGPLRNRVMIRHAQDQDGPKQVLAFFQTGAENKGTADCANKARRSGLPVKEVWLR